VPLNVHLAPGLVVPEDLAGSTTIVIDLIRATTTITSALAAGAERIIPCASIDEVRAQRDRFDPAAILTGGERRGLPIPGFDLGNGPAEYTPARIAGRTILFTTTNGTRAIRHAGHARNLLAGCFLNLDAVAALACRLTNPRHGGPTSPIHILCAGVDGRPCLEDTLCAGAIAERVAHRLEEPIADDQASLALTTWRAVASSPAALTEALHASEGGRNLIAIGFGSQIDECALLNATPIVPTRIDGGALIATRHDAL